MIEALRLITRLRVAGRSPETGTSSSFLFIFRVFDFNEGCEGVHERRMPLVMCLSFFFFFFKYCVPIN